MSIVAAGKIYTAQALGKPIPANWLVGADGLPTTDISHYPDVGSLLPMSGHKGYGLAILVEILAALQSPSRPSVRRSGEIGLNTGLFI